MHLSARHWAIALALAVGAHGGLAYGLLLRPEPPGAIATGISGIEVSLGPAGGAPGATPAEAVEDVEETVEATAERPKQTAPEPPPEVTAEQVEVETPPEVPVQEAIAEPAKIAMVPDALNLQEQVPEPEPELVPVVEAAPKPVENKPEPKSEIRKSRVPAPPPKPRPEKPVTRVAAVPQPEPAPTPVPDPVPQPAATDPLEFLDEIKTAAVRPSAPGADGRSGTEDSAEAGSGPSTAGGGSPGTAADYVTLLQAWLEKHKTYPRRARTRRQEGVVKLYFVIDRDGRVLEHRIEESSGYRILDREVADMIQRAAPMPAMPDNMDKAKLALVVPIQFRLR